MNDLKLKKSFTFTLSAELSLKVDALCKEKRISYSDFFRDLVKEKLGKCD